jgi:hypothetical protein
VDEWGDIDHTDYSANFAGYNDVDGDGWGYFDSFNNDYNYYGSDYSNYDMNNDYDWGNFPSNVNFGYGC